MKCHTSLFVLTVSTCIVSIAANQRIAAKWFPPVADKACSVRASVRAEDLSPGAISQGELRIKIAQPCVKKIDTVGLRLQLNEFSSMKYLKPGIVLPTHSTRDGSGLSKDDFLRPYFFPGSNNTDYSLYQESLRDPSLWELKAEERMMWKSDITLMNGSIDYVKPVIIPFSVASPYINYPPGVQESETIVFGAKDDKAVAESIHAYRYIAVVKFTDGSTTESPAGFTTFHPVHLATKPAIFTANVTFRKPDCKYQSDRRCESEIYSAMSGLNYSAQIILEGGDVVRAGDFLRGTVIFDRTIDTTVSMREVDVELKQEQVFHWAHTQSMAQGGGDSFNTTSCTRESHLRDITLSSCRYRRALGDDECSSRWVGMSHHIPVGNDDSIQFEIKVREDSVHSFKGYYADMRSLLSVSLGMSYPPSVKKCFQEADDALGITIGHGSADATNDDDYEDNLWSTIPPFVVPEEMFSLTADIPLTVLAAESTGIYDQPPMDYLVADVPSPVLLASPPASINEVAFPVSHPEIWVEPVEDTVRRLLSSSTSLFPSWSDRTSPTWDYFTEPYAGVLWQKKILAEDGRQQAPHEGFEEQGSGKAQAVLDGQ